MKIVSWNVNGIRAASKKGFTEFVEALDPDILCIQETKAHPDQLDETQLHPSGRKSYFSSALRKGYSGTATFVKEEPLGVSHGIGIRKFDDEGRFVVTRHKDFLLYNVYFPNGSNGQERHDFKQEFLKRFTKLLKKQIDMGEQIIVLGDYNVAYLEIDVYDPKRLSKVSGFLPEEREWFQSFLDVGFTDSFRHFHPDKPEQFSWWSYREGARPMNRGWRIDHICVTEGLVDRLQSAQILAEQGGSDHCPVLIELKDS
ncbi:MAG: exodeoxyribonuclease III [Bdellovibrionaceae bacterium]|nr:exodeoxyribonuclease III [Pseudobdellovibrionaceae bacterium]